MKQRPTPDDYKVKGHSKDYASTYFKKAASTTGGSDPSKYERVKREKLIENDKECLVNTFKKDIKMHLEGSNNTGIHMEMIDDLLTRKIEMPALIAKWDEYFFDHFEFSQTLAKKLIAENKKMGVK